MRSPTAKALALRGPFLFQGLFSSPGGQRSTRRSTRTARNKPGPPRAASVWFVPTCIVPWTGLRRISPSLKNDDASLLIRRLTSGVGLVHGAVDRPLAPASLNIRPSSSASLTSSAIGQPSPRAAQRSSSSRTVGAGSPCGRRSPAPAVRLVLHPQDLAHLAHRRPLSWYVVSPSIEDNAPPARPQNPIRFSLHNPHIRVGAYSSEWWAPSRRNLHAELNPSPDPTPGDTTGAPEVVPGAR